MFQEKCTNLESALESANNVSSVEIRALKREIILCTEKNDNLNQAYEDLKKQHEAMLFERETEIERTKKDLQKKLKDSEQKRTALDARMSEQNGEIAILKTDLAEKEQRLNEVMDMQKDSEITIDKLTKTIE